MLDGRGFLRDRKLHLSNKDLKQTLLQYDGEYKSHESYPEKEQLEERYCEALIDTRGSYDCDQLVSLTTLAVICTFVEGPGSIDCVRGWIACSGNKKTHEPSLMKPRYCG